MNTLRLLWLLVVLFALGDIATTAYGLTYADNIEESNPVAETAMDGVGVLVAMVSIKLTAIGLAACGHVVVQHFNEDAVWVVPLGLAIPWGIVTVLNILTLLAL